MIYGNLKIRSNRKMNRGVLALKTLIAAVCITALVFATPESVTFAMVEKHEEDSVPVVVDVSDKDNVIVTLPMEKVRTPERVEDAVDPLSEETTEVAVTEVLESDDTSNELGSSTEESETEEVEEESAPEEEATSEEVVDETEEEGEDVQEESLDEECTYVPSVRYTVTEEEMNLLLCVVEAEVTGYDCWIQRGLTHDQIINAKARVAQVFLNRVENQGHDFADVATLEDALLQENATSTIKDGRITKVEVTEYTYEAVTKALDYQTEDLTQGALFFSSGNSGRCGTKLFTDEVGHTFAK